MRTAALPGAKFASDFLPIERRTVPLAVLSLHVGGGLATTTTPVLPVELEVKKKQVLLHPATKSKQDRRVAKGENTRGSRNQASRPMEEPGEIMVRGKGAVKKGDSMPG